ncbi:TetR/AcrR family transcriptional regulator [Spiractinospora alimapuensis]|uniref:TetR/AcrR family transcriptional regulator n=1 Tax=Spiractinospora alimapuensis TaxID=2820884 RepID=UPI001F28F407|nr:TetR/AcrR family transcriptional regulator [Spiractinospora alimapuensis]QVQ51566.1 TetR/AcrR family transcriptional regulator [Spiractinospora alimapuensis]
MALPQHDVKVQQIRAAARELFLAHGFDRVSTSTLARKAGVSKETLYARYPNKDAILADVLEHLILGNQESASTMPSPRTRHDLETALTEFATHLSARLMQRDYLELARIVIAETPRLPHIGEVFREAVPKKALNRAAALLRTAHEAGVIGEIDVMAGARMLVGPLVVQVLMNGLLVAPAGEDTAHCEIDVRSHVALFLAALPTGITTTRSEE